MTTLLVVAGCGESDTAVSDSNGGDTTLVSRSSGNVGIETAVKGESRPDRVGSVDPQSLVASQSPLKREGPEERQAPVERQRAKLPDLVRDETPPSDRVATRSGPPPAEPKLVGKSEQIERYPDGQIRRRFIAKIYANNEVVFHGPYVEYYPNGKRFKQGMYVDGKQDGMWGYWHDNGRIAKKGKFIIGKHDGIWIYKTNRGHMRRQESYKNGLKDGLWIVYGREPGTKVREEQWKADRRHGKCTEFFTKTGQPQQVTEWLNGKKNGKQVIWFKDGGKAVEREYKDGELHGRAVAYAPSGAVRAELHYVNGVRQAK